MSAIFESGSSKLWFLCNEQTLLSLSTVIIALPSSIMLFLMHSTDLASTLKTNFCTSNLHCARFWIGQTLFFLSTVINAHLCSYLLVLCILRSCSHSQPLNFSNQSPIFHFYALQSPFSHSQKSWFLLFLCTLQILLSLSIAVIVYPNSILLYLCILQVCLSLSTVIIAHLSSILLIFFHCTDHAIIVSTYQC